MALGMVAGAVFAAGWGMLAGLLAGASQILDGVDGQYARLTGTESSAGAFLDSVLDRYSDGFLVLGLISLQPRTWFSGMVSVSSGGFSSRRERASQLYKRSSSESLHRPRQSDTGEQGNEDHCDCHSRNLERLLHVYAHGRTLLSGLARQFGRFV